MTDLLQSLSKKQSHLLKTIIYIQAAVYINQQVIPSPTPGHWPWLLLLCLLPSLGSSWPACCHDAFWTGWQMYSCVPQPMGSSLSHGVVLRPKSSALRVYSKHTFQVSLAVSYCLLWKILHLKFLFLAFLVAHCLSLGETAFGLQPE